MDILIPASLSDGSVDAFGNPISRLRGSNEFNGDGSGYAEVSSYVPITAAATWTFEVNAFSNNSKDVRFIGNWGTISNLSWLIFIDDAQLAGRLSVLVSSNGSSNRTFYFPVPDSHSKYAIRYNGDGTLDAFIDGTEVSVAISGSGATSISNNGLLTRIGTHQAPVDDTYLERPFGQLKIYDRALTDEEIQQL